MVQQILDKIYIIQHSNTSWGLRINGVNTTFSIVTQNLSTKTLTCTNLSANHASLYAANISTLTWTGILKFPNGTLSTIYNGARDVLWANATLPTSVHWYGLSLNAGTMYYNTGTSV